MTNKQSYEVQEKADKAYFAAFYVESLRFILRIHAQRTGFGPDKILNEINRLVPENLSEFTSTPFVSKDVIKKFLNGKTKRPEFENSIKILGLYVDRHDDLTEYCSLLARDSGCVLLGDAWTKVVTGNKLTKHTEKLIAGDLFRDSLQQLNNLVYLIVPHNKNFGWEIAFLLFRQVPASAYREAILVAYRQIDGAELITFRGARDKKGLISFFNYLEQKPEILTKSQITLKMAGFFIPDPHSVEAFHGFFYDVDSKIITACLYPGAVVTEKLTLFLNPYPSASSEKLWSGQHHGLHFRPPFSNKEIFNKAVPYTKIRNFFDSIQWAMGKCI